MPRGGGFRGRARGRGGGRGGRGGNRGGGGQRDKNDGHGGPFQGHARGDEAFVDLGAVKEADVGIATYMTEGDDLGFSALFKHKRYDFLVNEIDRRGNVVRLKSVGVPEVPVTLASAADGTANTSGDAGNGSANVGEQAGSEPAEVGGPAADGASAGASAGAGAGAEGGANASAEGGANASAEGGAGASAEGGAGASAEGGAGDGAEAADDPVVSMEALVEALGADAAAALATAVRAAVLPGAPEGGITVALPEGAGRAERIAFHAAVRAHTRGVVSATNAGELKVLNKASPKARADAPASSRKRKRGGTGGPVPGYVDYYAGVIPGRGRFTHFTLLKDNYDQNQALRILKTRSGAGQQAFGFMGSKDKRGVTVQRVSVEGVDPVRLVPRTGAGEAASTGDTFCVGDFSFEHEGLFLGLGRGNHFTVVLRQVRAPRERVERTLGAVSERGFVNYFGLQRFGNSSVATHHTGRDILRGDYAAALDGLVGVREVDKPELRRARAEYAESGDAAKAASMLPGWASVESTLFRAIAREGPGKPRNVLRALPRHMRTLYLHAYQSYVWNRAATERLTRFGRDSAVEGDLVLVRKEKGHTASTFAALRGAAGAPAAEVPAAEVPAAEVPAAEAEAPKSRGEQSAPEAWDPREMTAHVLTAEEASRTPLSDVVLPIPGTEVVLPANGVGELVASILAEDGITAASFRQAGEGKLKGGYRNLITRVDDLEWAVIPHDDPDTKLTRTDLDTLRGDPDPAEADLGTAHTSVRLSFSLPKSSYATMLIRELSREGTSAGEQVSLAARVQAERSGDGEVDGEEKNEEEKNGEEEKNSDPSRDKQAAPNSVESEPPVTNQE